MFITFFRIFFANHGIFFANHGIFFANHGIFREISSDDPRV